MWVCEWLPHQVERRTLCSLVHRSKHSVLHLKNKDSGNLHPMYVHDKNNSMRVNIYSSEEQVEGYEAVTKLLGVIIE